FLAYRMRRVGCKRGGVAVGMGSWWGGQNRLAGTNCWEPGARGQRVGVGEGGPVLLPSGGSGCRAVGHAGGWGVARGETCQLTGLGVDEIAWARGHTYLTLLYDIGGQTKRLLAVAEERKEASLRSCLDSLGDPVCLGVKYVCSDMWKPYLNVIGEKLGQ